jgi:REP element-mobilizing transposase RayT
VYSSKYHCVWTPKYRRRVLVGPIAKRCEQVMRQTAKKYRAEIIALEIMPDHVPVLVEVDPQFGIHRLVKNLKGVSSHTHCGKSFAHGNHGYPPFGRIAISYPRLAGHHWRS